ncbi:MAG: hypothetical protein HY049_01965 [Acidobacteria bacterium]|nr:hypothetical protein [Acidobacteriota bacterium]
MSDRGDRLRVDFNDQGYLLVFDERGVVIHVTDYHAGPLRVSWETLAGWRRQATPEQRALPFPTPLPKEARA